MARRYTLSAYDASYLELALRLGISLATLDVDLQAAAKKAGVKKICVKLKTEPIVFQLSSKWWFGKNESELFSREVVKSYCLNHFSCNIHSRQYDHTVHSYRKSSAID